MCGNASETFGRSGISWRITTLCSPKYAVGPYGMCETISPSGTPRCSWSTTRSLKPSARHVSTIVLTVWPPRFIRCAFGTISFTSFRNCVSFDDGSCDVVISTRGSATPAFAYSESTPLAAASPSSGTPSSAASAISRSASPRSSDGTGAPASNAALTFLLRSCVERSAASTPLV